MLRIAICDDEEQSVADTKRMLECWASGASAPLKIDCFDNGDSLIRENDSSRYDIIFLDIVMPLLNGIDTARELRERDKTVKIVFLTSSPEFALINLEPDRRKVTLDLHMQNDKLLLSIKNPYTNHIDMVDGIPQAKGEGHGLGTHSIKYITEKLNGNCQFLARDGEFALRVVL